MGVKWMQAARPGEKCVFVLEAAWKDDRPWGPQSGFLPEDYKLPTYK